MSRKSSIPFFSGIWVYQLLPSQVIPNNAGTPVRLNGVLYDLLNEFNPVTNRFVPREAGYYLIIGAVAWLPVVLVGIRRNYIWNPITGTSIAGTEHYGSLNLQIMFDCSCIEYLTPNDAIELRVYQNSGFAEAIFATGTRDYVHLIIRRIG